MWWQALGLAQGFLAWLRGVGLVEWISLWAVVGLTVYCIVLGSLSATWACIQVNLKVFLGWMNSCMVLSLINHKRRMREMCLSVWGVQYLILSNSSMVCGRARGWVGGWVCVCVDGRHANHCSKTVGHCGGMVPGAPPQHSSEPVTDLFCRYCRYYNVM